MKKKIIFFASCVLSLVLLLTPTYAAQLNNFSTEIISTNSQSEKRVPVKIENPSVKEQIEKFIEKNPQYKDQVMEILKKNNALNPDNTIKDIAQETTKHSGSFSTMSPPPLYTGYYYDFITTAEMDATWEKTTVWTATNYSYDTPLVCHLTETYSATAQFQTGITIGSEAKLAEAFKLKSGVEIGWTKTWAASVEFGVELSLKPRRTGTISANPIYTLYIYEEQFYIYGIPIGNSQFVSGLKPTAAHWYFSEKTI